MQESEKTELHGDYLRAVAAIRAFEPELEAKLLHPLGQIPSVVRVDWRIKPWEAVLAKLQRKRDGGRQRFGLADMPDMLGIRVVITDLRFAEAICDLVGRAFRVADDVRYHDSGGSPTFHREHLTVAARLQGNREIVFEVQILSRLAEAIISADHASHYGRDSASVSPSELSTGMLERRITRPGMSKVGAAVASLEGVIETFEKMIADPTVHEKQDIHPFLDKHRFLLHPAPESIVSEPPIGLGTRYRIDFIIREPTGEYVLVELENPRHKLFIARGDPAAVVTHAIQQVENWQEWIEQNIQTVQREYPDMLSPQGLVVIGRSGSLAADERQKIARRNINTRGRFRIETYDEIVTKARAHVAGLRQALGL